jgi:O-glycosyl hydrolase
MKSVEDLAQCEVGRREFIRMALIGAATPICLSGIMRGEAAPASPQSNAPLHEEESTCNVTLSGDVQQRITGWGCFPGWVAWGERIATDKSLQDAIYRNLGITVARVPIMPDYGNRDGSLNTEAIDKSLVRQLETMRDYSIRKWIVTTWSPPLFMKVFDTSKGNLNGQPNHLKVEFEDAFASYYAKVLAYIRDTKSLAMPLYATIQNEPDYAADWDGCVYPPEQWRRVTIKLRKALDDMNLKSVKIHGTDHNHYTLKKFLGPGLSNLTSDPELLKALDGIAFHSYSEGKESGGAAAVEARDLILKFKQLKRGSEIWETEFSTTVSEDLNDSSIRHLRSMMRDIGYLQANSYLYWLGSSDTEKYRGEELICNGTRTKLYFVFQKLWNCVTPGSFCVKTFAGNDDPDLKSHGPDPMDMLAFVSKDKTVVLFTNPFPKAKKLALKGLAGTRVALYRTSDNEDMAPIGSQSIDNGESIVSLPGRSILFLETNGGVPSL